MASSKLAARKSTGRIERWKKGDPITAKRLQRMASNINDNTEGLAGPKQQGAKEQSDSAEVADFTFTETSRQETTVTLTDSGGDTVQVNQIDQVTMQNSSGQTLVLNFNNP